MKLSFEGVSANVYRLANPAHQNLSVDGFFEDMDAWILPRMAAAHAGRTAASVTWQ